MKTWIMGLALLFLTACAGQPDSVAGAIVRGDREAVEAYLEEGGDPNSVDELGRTPLHWAAHFGQAEIARMLLMRGADLERQGPLGTPLAEAAWMGHPRLVDDLLTAGADPASLSVDGESPLELAIRGAGNHPERGENYEEVIRTLGQATTFDRLLEAAAAGNTRAVDRLLGSGVDPAMAGRNGATALHLAAAGGHVEIIAALLKAGAAVDARDRSESTALHYAARASQKRAIQALDSGGAELDAINKAGQTALLIAAEAGTPATLLELLDLGANPNVPDSYGWTPLHKAAANGDRVSVEGLLKYGASPNVVNDGGQTPADVAERYGHRDLAALLRSRLN